MTIHNTKKVHFFIIRTRFKQWLFGPNWNTLLVIKPNKKQGRLTNVACIVRLHWRSEELTVTNWQNDELTMANWQWRTDSDKRLYPQKAPKALRMDAPSCRVARTHLKTKAIFAQTNCCCRCKFRQYSGHFSGIFHHSCTFYVCTVCTNLYESVRSVRI